MFTYYHPWRRTWQPTPVFLLGKPHEQRSLASYSPWGRKELDMTEQLSVLSPVSLPRKERVFWVIKTNYSGPLNNTSALLCAWKIPWMEEPGRLQTMGSLGVVHYWSTSVSLFIFMHWRRQWQPTPVFLPGESQGLGSLVGCRLCGCTESDTTEAT